MRRYLKELIYDRPKGSDLGKIIFFSSFSIISSNTDFFYHGWAVYLSKFQIKMMFFLSLTINIFFIFKFINNLFIHFKNNNFNLLILKILFKPFFIWGFLVILYLFAEYLPFPAFLYLFLFVGFVVYLKKFIEKFDQNIKSALKEQE